jgi:plasmid stabilization system protein ParE
VAHIAADNPSTAQMMGLRIVAHMKKAASFPQIGPIYTRAWPNEVRCITEGNYRLYYRVKAEVGVVEVLSVRHSARQTPQF